MLDQFRAMADARHPAQARLTAHQREVLAWAVGEIDRLRAVIAAKNARIEEYRSREVAQMKER